MPKDTSIRSVLIIGSGPIIIGQACEFDYSGTQAARNLADRIAKIGGDLNNIDLAVDDLIRQLNNQPPRPSDRKAYEGIFPVDKVDIQLNVPFYPQTDNYTQPDRTCNSSSCAMVAKFLS